MGTCSGSPYVAAVEENTKLSTEFARIASSSVKVVTTLCCQYSAGISTDSPTSERAAKCTTPSKPPCASTSAARSATSPSTKVARSEEHTSELQSRGHLV